MAVHWDRRWIKRRPSRGILQRPFASRAAFGRRLDRRRERTPCRAATSSSVPLWSSRIRSPSLPGNAAPRAVVSMAVGRSTRVSRRSDCICIRRLFPDAPPSTRTSSTTRSVSSAIVSATSVTWCAIDSNAALATCARVALRVRPAISPAPAGSSKARQARRTRVRNMTPAVSTTSEARRSESSTSR